VSQFNFIINKSQVRKYEPKCYLLITYSEKLKQTANTIGAIMLTRYQGGNIPH